MLSRDKYKIKYYGLVGGSDEEEDKAAFERFMKQTGIGLAIADIIEYHPKILTMRDKDGNTPLHHVAKEGWVYLVKDILKEAPNLLYTRNKVGKTPLDVAIKDEVSKIDEVVKILSTAMKAGCGVCHST